MKEAILQLLREQDTFAVIDFAARQSHAMAVILALDELMRDLYWKQKDLPASIAMGRIGAQHALAAASRMKSENPALAAELRGKAKAFCYNLASFAWSGWGEQGHVVTASDEAMGLDAARANLRLGRELNRSDLPMSRGWWMLGAQQMSARDYPGAVASFGNAEHHARAAGERGDELLAVAFARLAEFLGHRFERAKFDRVAAAIRELLPVKEGTFFAQQVVTALKVFYPECEGLAELTQSLPVSSSDGR
jgi:hypothetical protein